MNKIPLWERFCSKVFWVAMGIGWTRWLTVIDRFFKGHRYAGIVVPRFDRIRLSKALREMSAQWGPDPVFGLWDTFRSAQETWWRYVTGQHFDCDDFAEFICTVVLKGPENWGDVKPYILSVAYLKANGMPTGHNVALLSNPDGTCEYMDYGFPVGGFSGPLAAGLAVTERMTLGRGKFLGYALLDPVTHKTIARLRYNAS